MINIQIERDGRVFGDVNMVAAYEHDRYSQPIRILHPDFSHAIHKVKYRQGRIESTDVISGDDMMRFIVSGSGLVRFQYVAEDARTGIPILTSAPWTLNVARSKMKPSGEDPAHRLHGPDMLREHLDLITERLKDVGIINTSKTASIYNCNELIDEKEYIVGPLSENTPDGTERSEKKWLLRIKRAEGVVIQTAQLLESGHKAIFYRTGTLQPHADVIWTEWDPLFYENAATVTEGEDVNAIAFSPGQYTVIHNEDNTYSLFYDLVEGSTLADRVLISTTPDGGTGEGILNITSDSYENNTYKVTCENIEVPYEGMICVFLPQSDNAEGVTSYIKFNETIAAPIYVRTAAGKLQPLRTLGIRADVPSILLYSKNRWITNATLVVDNTQQVATIVDAFDFAESVFKDSVIPKTVERLINKVNSISDSATYTDDQYPTVNAVRDYIENKMASSGDTVSSRVLAGNAPSSVRDFVHVLLTYVTRSDKFLYGDLYTALDNNCTNQLNMATLIELALRGIDYYHSKYVGENNRKCFSYATKLITPEGGKFNNSTLVDYAISYGRAFSPDSWLDILPGDVVVTSSHHPLKVFIGKSNNRALLIGFNNDDILKCEHVANAELPSHVLRFPLNFVNELYSFNICATSVSTTLSEGQSIELSLDKPLQAEEPYTVHIDHVMLSAGDTVTLRYDLKDGETSSELSVFGYIASEDYVGSIDFPILIGKDDIESVSLVNASSHIIDCQGVGIYEGLIQPPTDYTTPLSATQTAGSSILVYT